MPYSNISDLPQSTSKLPKHAKEIYMAAFNSAHEQYDDEATAHATAWAAVKKKFKKNESGKWVSKRANSQVNPIVPATNELLRALINAEQACSSAQHTIMTSSDAINAFNKLDVIQDQIIPELQRTIDALKSIHTENLKSRAKDILNKFKADSGWEEEKAYLPGSSIQNRVLANYISKSQ